MELLNSISDLANRIKVPNKDKFSEFSDKEFAW
uniref:Uncharacterized protein n=1 Tax=Tetranychus urticae TaxID=32264 RepID=T1KVY6_TETUR